MRLWLKITLLEVASAVIIVCATRAYVLGSYKWTAFTEVAFIVQWFWSRNIPFEDERSRSWRYGFPAYLVGAVGGTLLGLAISQTLLGG